MKRIIVLYLSLIFMHVGHVFEEVWGRFWIMNKVGLGLYLFLNLLLFAIPLLLFYHTLSEKRWAIVLSTIYAIFMGMQGIGHTVAVIVTHRYFDGFAGCYTGLVMIVISPFLIFNLLNILRTNKQK